MFKGTHASPPIATFWDIIKLQSCNMMNSTRHETNYIKLDNINFMYQDWLMINVKIKVSSSNFWYCEKNAHTKSIVTSQPFWWAENNSNVLWSIYGSGHLATGIMLNFALTGPHYDRNLLWAHPFCIKF
jgi:hypothetical protein